MAPANDALVSVVIVVSHDPRVLDCLESVLAQEVSFPLEVRVACDGPDDPTIELVREAHGGDDRVAAVGVEGSIPAAWNAVAKRTRGHVLVRVDADAVPEPGWLASLVEPIRGGVADWTAGPVEGVRPDGNLVERYFHHRTVAFCERLGSGDRLPDGVPSWNVAYRRGVLEEAGWFDPWQVSSEDWDLHHRINGTGGRGRFVEAARVRHHHPSSLRGFLRKESWYKTGQVQLATKYGLRQVTGLLALPGAYALVLILALGSLAFPLAAPAAVGLLVLLLLVHALSGVREGDPRWWYRPVFRPLEALAGLHGVARGVLRYGLRRRPPLVGRSEEG